MKVFLEDSYILKWQEDVWLVGSEVLSGLALLVEDFCFFSLVFFPFEIGVKKMKLLQLILIQTKATDTIWLQRCDQKNP